MDASAWTFSHVSLHDHICEVFEPPPGEPPPAVILYLHDQQAEPLAEQVELAAEFSRRGLPMFMPHTGRSWWTDRICPRFDPRLSPERYILDHVLPHIRQRWQVEPPRIGLFGIGMGGQGALRLAYKHPSRFPVVAALWPAIDFQQCFDDEEVLRDMYPDPEAVRQESALLYVHPLNWPRHQFFACDPQDQAWWDSADRLRMKLWSLGVPFEADLETSTAGDRAEYQRQIAPRAVAFLAERLEQERLRLV